MRVPLILLLCGILAVTAACEEELPTAADDRMLVLATQRTEPVLVLAERELDRFPRDPYRILSIDVDDELLRVRVRYRGCTPHPFRLIAFERFQFPPRGEGFFVPFPGFVHPGFFPPVPPHLTLILSHDARGDLCPDFFHEELRFDLAPVRDHYRRTFGFEDGEIVLVISGFRVLWTL